MHFLLLFVENNFSLTKTVWGEMIQKIGGKVSPIFTGEFSIEYGKEWSGQMEQDDTVVLYGVF